MMNYSTLRLGMLMLAFAALSTVTIAQTAVWTEDFSDGGMPAGWVSEDASGNGGVWTWCDDPVDAVGAGCVFAWSTYVNQHGPFASETATNGFMVMDSDFLGGLANPPHVVRLTSAPIDCSSLTEVWVKSENLIGVWEYPTTDNAVMRVSTDGVNWTTFNLFNIASGMSGNEPGVSRWTLNPGYAVTDISAIAAGQSTVYLQWSWTGNYEYYWLLDDVTIYDSDPSLLFFAEYDMLVSSEWAATAPNVAWPLSMVERFGFLADVENVGLQDQTNVNLNITIEDMDGNVVYTEDLAYGTIAADSLAENVPFAGAGFLPTAGGVYTGTYTVSSDETDENADNNSFSFQFLVGDTLFAKELEVIGSTRPADASWSVGETWSWAYGNSYYVPDAGTNNFFNYIFFSLDETADFEDENVTVRLYKWTDTNNDADCNPSERTALATVFYTITGDEAFDQFIAVPVTTLFGDPVPLEDNTHYIAMVEFQSPLEGSTVRIGAADNGFDYGAMTLRSTLDGAPRYADFVGIGDNLEVEDYFSGGFTGTVIPAVRLSFGEISSVREELKLDGNLAVFPNPANQSVSLDMNFNQTMRNVSIQLFDINGKLLETRALENVKQQQAEFNVQALVPGTYLLKVTTEQGTRSERFKVQR